MSESFPSPSQVAAGKRTTPTTAKKAKAKTKKGPAAPTGKPTGTTTTLINPTFVNGLDDVSNGQDTANLAAKVSAVRSSIAQGNNPDLASIADATVTTGQPFWTPGGSGSTGSRKSIGSLLEDMTNWSEAETKAMQEKLWAAGYYPPQMYQDPTKYPVSTGNKYDAATRQAYALLLSDGVTYTSSSLDQILSDRATEFGRTPLGQPTARAGEVGGGNVYETQLSDPATIRSLADDVAQSLLGRKPTDEDKAKYVHLITSHQASEQAIGDNAREAASRRTFDTRVANANVTATAGDPGFEGFLRNTIGQESGGDPTAEGLPTVHGIATGKYQVLDSTWDGYGGFKRAKDAPVEVQDRFARERLSALYTKYGAAGAAVAWYAGEGVAKQFMKNPSDPKWQKPQHATGRDGKPVKMKSIADYAATASGPGPMPTTGNTTATVPTAAPNDVYIAPTYVTSHTVDARADLNEQIRKDNPGEAGAHDIALQYKSFQQLLGGA